MQTVREQLVAALEAQTGQLDRAREKLRLGEIVGALGPIETGKARAALDRARAEPECGDGCATECACYQAGLEAQREPAGRGTT